MGSDARNAAVMAGSTGGYRRRSEESELLLPKPHALEPGVGLLKAPAVIALENIGDGEHQVERAPVVATAADGLALHGIGELEQIELREPVALLKCSQGVILLASQFPAIGKAAARPLDQRTEESSDALKEDEQSRLHEAPKGSDSPCARQWR